MDDQTRDRLRQLLNMTPADRLEALEAMGPSPDEVGRGLSGAIIGGLFGFIGAISRAAFLPAALRSGDLEFLPLHCSTPIDLRLARRTSHPSVVLVETAADVAPLFGSWEQDEKLWACDGRYGPAALHLQSTGAGAEVVVVVDAGGVELHQLIRDPDLALRALAEAPLPSLPEVPMPPVDELLEGLPTVSWLTDQAHELAASVVPLDRLAAAGLVGRLWELAPREGASASASSASPAGDLFDRMVRREQLSAFGVARRWCEKYVPTSLANELEPLALQEADRLSDLLEAAELAVGEENPSAATLVRAVALGRDDLACVEFALRASGKGDLLAAALSAIDLQAEASLPALRLVAPIDEERLHAVAWQDPDAWWGLLAVSDDDA